MTCDRAVVYGAAIVNCVPYGDPSFPIALHQVPCPCGRQRATSGDTLSVVEVRINCEQNSLLYMVRRNGGGACHAKDAEGNTRPGCYYRTIVDPETLAWA